MEPVSVRKFVAVSVVIMKSAFGTRLSAFTAGNAAVSRSLRKDALSLDTETLVLPDPEPPHCPGGPGSHDVRLHFLRGQCSRFGLRQVPELSGLRYRTSKTETTPTLQCPLHGIKNAMKWNAVTTVCTLYIAAQM